MSGSAVFRATCALILGAGLIGCTTISATPQPTLVTTPPSAGFSAAPSPSFAASVSPSSSFEVPTFVPGTQLPATEEPTLPPTTPPIVTPAPTKTPKPATANLVVTDFKPSDAFIVVE